MTEWKTVFPIFPSLFLHLPCFYKFPPYKGKLSTISIFRWFIAFGTTPNRRVCQPVPMVWKKNKFPPLPSSGQLWDPTTGVMLTPVIRPRASTVRNFRLHSSCNSICSCSRGLTTLFASHHCVWTDPRKEFVPPWFRRRCNDRYFVAAGGSEG